MKKTKIDYNLQVRVYKYLEHLCIKEDYENREKETQILGKLSQSLRNDVLIQANGRILSGCNALVDNFSFESLQKMCERARTLNFAPDEVIYSVKN